MLKYDFTFADLAAKFLETDDASLLQQIADTDAARHLFNHANMARYGVPRDTPLDIVNHYLLAQKSPEERKALLPAFKANIEYAKENIVKDRAAEKIVLEYLPAGFEFSGSIFFTFGYDVGVAYGNNCSLNLAVTRKGDTVQGDELRYWAIHEMHHAGFNEFQDKELSLDISTYRDVTEIIERLTHAEAMATYAPLEIRRRENAMDDIFKDYITMQDADLMAQLEKEYFEIYHHFKSNPNNTLTEEDWLKLSIPDGGGKRLYYTVGARMAATIDKKLGRERLVNLIKEPSANFIATYLSL